MRRIRCNKCGRLLGILRDASIRKGTVYTCRECADKPSSADVPEFLKGIFR